MRESVAGAEAVIDWGRYTWAIPWIALGAAAAAGYLVYTGSHQKMTADTESLADPAAIREPAVAASAKGEKRSKIAQNSLLATWGILFPVAVSAGQNLVLHWLEEQQRTRSVKGPVLSPSGGERGGRAIDGSPGAVASSRKSYGSGLRG